MDNVTAQVALISTSGTVAVALLGVMGTVFGESWREQRRASEAAESAEVARRYLALQVFAAALLRATRAYGWEDRIAVEAARVDFVATLRKGEGRVADFTADLVDAVAHRKPVTTALTIATDGADELFAWLRGDKLAADLKVLHVPAEDVSE